MPAGSGRVAGWLVLLVLAGCGGEPAAAPESPPSAASPSPSAPADSAAAADSPRSVTPEVRVVPAAGLPIGDYLPPLDDGRVEIPIPAGWAPLPRDSSYLVRFYKNDRNALPRIEVHAEDKSSGGIETVTEQNVVQFAQSIGAELQSEGKKLIEPVLPMRIGNSFCARYVLRVKLKMAQGSVVVERQTLVMAKAGRAYTIHLLVLPNRLLADRDAAYAVCAGLK